MAQKIRPINKELPFKIETAKLKQRRFTVYCPTETVRLCKPFNRFCITLGYILYMHMLTFTWTQRRYFIETLFYTHILTHRSNKKGVER